MLYPPGSRQPGNVWVGGFIMNVPETSSSVPTTPTPTPSITPTQTITPTNTNTPTNTGTPTQTPTQTLTPTNTGTPTQTPTNTQTQTPTNTNTPTPSITPSSTPPAPLLLDTYTGATMAVSVRKLRNAYSGSAIRVRRSSDNTEQDIGFSGGNLDTSALLSFVGSGGTDNGFITTWYDQSGNGNNHLQATAVNQPKIVNNGVVLTLTGVGTARPKVQFDGVNDSMRATGTSLSTASITTFTSGFKPFINLNTYSNLGAISNASWGFLTSPVYGSQFARASDGLNYVSINSPTIDTSLISGVYSDGGDCNTQPGSIRQYQNGVAASSTATALCRRVGTNAVDNFATLTELQEYILYYGTAQSAGNIGAIQTNQNAYFNLY
jgi:hypothetical protein